MAKTIEILEKTGSVKDADDAVVTAGLAIQEVTPILEHARSLEVTDQGSYEIAMEGAARCARGKARVEELFGEARDLAHKAHKAITGAIKRVTDPLKRAQDIYSRKAYAWEKAEKDRLEAEELARQEAEREKLEDQKADVAEFLDAAGAHDEAEQLLDEEPVSVAPRKVEGPTRPEGTSTRENWQWRCEDLKALVEAVASGGVPLSVVTTAGPVITKMVKALKGETNLPGIRVWDQGTVAVKRGS